MLILMRDTSPGADGGIVVDQADHTIFDLPSTQHVLKTHEPVIGVPRRVRIGGQESCKDSLPVFLSLIGAGRLIGFSGIFVDLDIQREGILGNDFSIFDNDCRYLTTGDGMIITHNNTGYQGQPIQVAVKTDVQPLLSAFRNKTDGIYDYTNTNNVDILVAIPSFEIGHCSGVYWSAVIATPRESLFSTVCGLRNLVIVAMVISLAVICFFCLLYVRLSIANRIINLSSYLTQFFRYLKLRDKRSSCSLD